MDPDLPELTIEPTKETYDQFQEAYAYFNRVLFEGQLPNCLITLQRNKRSDHGSSETAGNRLAEVERKDGREERHYTTGHQ